MSQPSPQESSVDYNDQVDVSFWQSWGMPITPRTNGYFETNPHANLLPNIDDSLRDTQLRNEWRLGNGMGISRAFRKPDSQLSEGFKGILSSPGLAQTKLFGRNTKTPEVSRNVQVDYALRNINNNKYDEVPEGAGYKEYDWNVPLNGSGARMATTNNLAAHLHNRNAHYLDHDMAAKRIYKPPPSRLTKKLHVEVEKNQLRPQNMIRDPMKVFENDPRNYIQMRTPRNADVREMVTTERRDGVLLRGAGPMNGVVAQSARTRVDHFKRPIAYAETGTRDILNRWGQPNPTRDGNGVLRQNEQDRMKYEDNQSFIRGYRIQKELDANQRSASRLNAMPVPDPFNLHSR